MTINISEVFDKKKLQNRDSEPHYLSLIQKYEINIENFPVISNDDIKLSFGEKALIIEKLLQAHKLAKANVEACNITGRGFASNICTTHGIWALGTNFNNTRNDISSICGERSAVITAYNKALIEFSKSEKTDKKFDFKIKYLCMAQSAELEDTISSAVPCEDCLSWLNTNRYFDDNTLIFAFEKSQDNILSLKATKLCELLPYKNISTQIEIKNNIKLEYTKSALKSIEKFNVKENTIIDLINKNIELYKNNTSAEISGQNIVASIYSNDEIFSAKKIDWTKRWFLEPLEMAVSKAVEKYSNDTKVTIVSYIGDESPKNNPELKDGVVSIKTLGRIRQKYASNDTLLVLNMGVKFVVTTIGGYLPKKFIQGYKII